MNITILTATIPERADMLAEAKASVEAQQLPAGVDVQHIVLTDHLREGAGPVLDDGLQLARGSWLMVLDDDDLLHPNHISTVVMAAVEHVDVVYTLPEVEGGRFYNYHFGFDPALLEQRNIVSHNALMRTAAVRAAGGWNAVRTFDWDLFKRLAANGCEFRQVREVTWTYRLHGANWSHGTLEGVPS